MKQFVFTLQSLYDMKIKVEDQQKIQMKRIQDKQRGLIDELNVFKKTFDITKEKFNMRLNEGAQTDELAQYSQYFTDINSLIMLQKENIAQVEKEKQKLLEAQIEIKKEIKMLNKLRENQYEEYLQEVKLEEEKIMGDIVCYNVITK